MKVDVAIIGAGSAGINARRQVERAGKSWVQIDPGPLGTTCARVGCMPSKLLISAADRVQSARIAPELGIEIPEIRVDGVAVMKRVRALRDRFVGGVLRGFEELTDEQLIRQRARFVGPTTLETEDGRQIEAGTVVIAVGSSPFIPPGLEDLGDRILLNDDIFELEDLPESLAVVGTGIIALELGQAMHRLGVRTAFFNPFDELGPTTDPAVNESVREILGAELALHIGIEPPRYTRVDAGVRVEWSDAKGSHSQVFERILVAAGRRPNVLNLGLETTGAELVRGIPVYDPTTMQVGKLPIFIAGDVTGELALLHEASDEGHIAGHNAAAWPAPALAHVRRTPLAIAFTDPNIAMVGQPFSALEPDTFVTGEVDLGDQGRSRVMAENRGILRLYVDRVSRLILGAEMVGPRMEHIAHLVAWAISENMTVDRALAMPFYHPVVEEGLRTAIRTAAAKLGRAPSPCVANLDCEPGN